MSGSLVRVAVRRELRLPKSGCRYLLENMDWLEEELGDFENDYLVIDCPGWCIFIPCSEIAEEFLCRSDRIVYTPSLLPDSRGQLKPTRGPDMCCLPARIAVHGRQVQILQVRRLSLFLSEARPYLISLSSHLVVSCLPCRLW